MTDTILAEVHHRHTGVDSHQVSYNHLLDKPTPPLWTLVASAQLASSSATLIDAQNISTDYDMFRITFYLVSKQVSSSLPGLYVRLNNDSGANYTKQISRLSGGSLTGTGASGETQAQGIYGVISNGNTATGRMLISKPLSTKAAAIEATSTYEDFDAGGLVTSQTGNKWANTSDKISRITILSGSAGEFDIGSAVTIEGATIS